MLNDKTLKSSLQAGALLPVYIIAGDDVYLKRQALDRIIDACGVKDDEMNLISFETDSPLQQIYDELTAFPLMAEKKCVILSDYNFDEATKNDFNNLLEMASEAYETSVFVLYFANIQVDFKKSDKFKKLMSAVSKAGGDTVRLDHKSVDELARWLCALAKKRDCDLSSATAKYVIEVCSADISVLTSEIGKLCAFQKSGEITRDTVDKVCVKSVEASLYDLSTKVIAGDTAGAMKLLDELFYMNKEPIVIFHSIASAYVDMYRAKVALAAKKDLEDTAKEFGMGSRAFVLKKAAVHLRKFDEKKLNLSFNALLSCEREIKGYVHSQRDLIEKLIVKLIYIMKTGEALD